MPPRIQPLSALPVDLIVDLMIERTKKEEKTWKYVRIKKNRFFS
jgi:hypothetical protein